MPDFLSEPQRWVIPAVLIVALLGVPLMLWRERRDPTSYTRAGDSLAAWRAMPAAEQEAADTAVLDLAEQAELDARAEAEDAARGVAERAVERAAGINSLFRP